MEEHINDTAMAREITDGAAEAPQQEEPARMFTQAEVDRMIRQRLARAQRDEAARLEAARAEARAEAERLSRMTAEERVRHEREQVEEAARAHEAELSAREAALQRRELRAGAIDQLIARELPGELEACLDYSGEEACAQSIDRLDRAFRRAVQAGVDARLRQGGITLKNAQPHPDTAAMNDAEYYASLRG